MLMPLLVQPLLSPLLIPPHCWPLRWTVHPGPSKCSPLHLPPLSCRLSYWSLIAGIRDPIIPNFIQLLIFPNNPEVSSQTMVVNTKPEMSMLIIWLWSPGVMVRCSEGNCRGINKYKIKGDQIRCCVLYASNGHLETKDDVVARLMNFVL